MLFVHNSIFFLICIQLFEKRTAVVTANEMEKYWQNLSQAYMTEESDDPESPDNIIQHKLSWRSKSNA